MLIATGIFEFLPDGSLGQKGAQPSAEHKRGFRATFFNKKMGVAEFSANGAGANMGLEALWKQVQAQQSANPSKLPVVEYKGSGPEKVGKGTTRVPLFEVVSWVARPAAMSLDNSGGFDPEVSVPVKPAPTPVKAKPAPAPSQSDDEMFS